MELLPRWRSVSIEPGRFIFVAFADDALVYSRRFRWLSL